MKQLSVLVLIVLVGCGSVRAQSKKDSATKAAIARQVNDSTPLLTAKDLQELITMIQDYPAKYANPISNWLQQRFAQRAQEYALKPTH